MAEAERSNKEGAGAMPERRREELEELLKRIATHIVEADKDADWVASAPAPADSSREIGGGATAVGEAQSSPVGHPPEAKVSGPVAPPAAPILNRSDRSTSPPAPKDNAPAAEASRRDAGLRPRAPASHIHRSPSAIEPPALRSALDRPAPSGRDSGDSATAHGAGSRPKSPGVSGRASSPASSSAGLPGVPGTSSPQTVQPIGGASHGSRDEAPGDAADLDASLPPLRSMLDLMAAAPRSKAGGDRDSEPAGMGGGAERPSAEVRLAELARRIEAALETLAPREAVDQLGVRFTRIEAEVGRAVGELTRLDGIEAQLGVLGTRLTDEQIVALFGPLVPTAEDLIRFAEDAAGRAADRVLAAHAGEMLTGARTRRDEESYTGQQAASLSELLSTYIEERRRNDAGTQEALETLHLAMQHVLDRFDQAGALNPLVASAPPASTPRRDVPTQAPESLFTAPERMPGERLSPRSFEHGLDFGPASDDEVQSPPVAPGSGAATVGSTDEAVLAPSYESRLEPMEGGALASGPPYPRRGVPSADLPRQTRYEPYAPPPPAEGNPRALIATARRAAERAKVEASRAGEKAEKPSKAKTRGGLVSGGEGSALAGVRPGVLVVTTLAAFLLAGYWLLSSPKVGIPGSAMPTTIEQTEAPSRQPATGEAPTPTPEPESAPKAEQPAPTEAVPPATPKPISDDVPFSAPAGSLQEARLDRGPTQSAGPGMSVVLSDHPATIEQVVQAHDRARLASLSQRTGYVAARTYTAPQQASPVTTAALPSEPAAAPAAAADPTAAPAATARALALPAAATGPLSLRLAAAQGNASAQLEIATRLAEGRGVKQNFSEAVQWYERSAAQGEAIALYRLGALYERGLGVKPDRERARAFYRQAAEAGNVKAMHNLAVMSVGAPGGVPDYSTAAALFSKAAGYGLSDSQYNLGILYESGLGVPKDYVAAYRWYALAARSGDREAGRRRDLLISRLPAQILQSADGQIASWRPAPMDQRANDARIAGEAWKQLSAEVRQ